MLSGMAALNGGLGSAGLTNGTAGTMDALTQAYSGIQQYAAAALPTLYSQSLLQQQGAAGSQKEGQCFRRPRSAENTRKRNILASLFRVCTSAELKNRLYLATVSAHWP